jgi:hypothetical protein
MADPPKRKLRLYVDESGDHTFRPAAASYWDRRYLCLFGCAFDLEPYETEFRPAFESLKGKHFGSDPDDPVILHREDMKARRGPFAILRDSDKADAFNADLLALVGQAKFRAFAVVVDKHSTQTNRYGPLPYHPYHVALLALMERCCGWLNFMGWEGDILAESRGGREDLQLKSAYKTVHSSGTRFRPPDFFQKALTSKEIKIKPKTQNIPGLQLADLFAYPAKRRVLLDYQVGPALTGFTVSMADALESKYNVQVYTGTVRGYGKIFLG